MVVYTVLVCAYADFVDEVEVAFQELMVSHEVAVAGSAPQPAVAAVAAASSRATRSKTKASVRGKRKAATKQDKTGKDTSSGRGSRVHALLRDAQALIALG